MALSKAVGDTTNQSRQQPRNFWQLGRYLQDGKHSSGYLQRLASRTPTTFTLDGIGITSVSWGGAAVITPNEDSVKEVSVISNDYDAENGRFAGAQIQVITRTAPTSFMAAPSSRQTSPA